MNPTEPSPQPDTNPRRLHRLRTRLWTLLHAQILLDGAGRADSVEDDYRRFAARRGNPR